MISLKKYGIDFEGPVEVTADLDSSIIPDMKIHFEATGTYWYQKPPRYLQNIGPVEKWRNVDKWVVYERTEDPRFGRRFVRKGEVYEKKSDTSLFKEACLQIYAKQMLDSYGLGQVIADIQDILRRKSPITGTEQVTFTMTPFINVVNVHEAMRIVDDSALTGNAFDLWFIPIFVQIVVLLGLLEERLLMNHRDLKGDNILLTLTSEQRQREVELGGRTWRYLYREEIRLIDFGFACKGEELNGPSQIIAGGDIFGDQDRCPKEGRDIYMLLCYFYALPEFRKNASATLLTFVRRLLGAPRILEELERHGLRRFATIYLLVGHIDFRSCECSYLRVLNDIAELWPTLLECT